MKRFWLLAVAVLLLWLDIYMAVGPDYPEYVPDENMGRKTQELVMGHVVGDAMKLDVVPDILGYVLILFVSIGGTKGKRGFAIASLASVVGIAAEVLCMVLPYYVGGATVYGAEFFLHMGGYLIELAAVFFAVQSFITDMDEMTVHRIAIVGGILMMLSLLCGLAQNVGYFYNISVLPTVYTVARGIITVGFLGCLYFVTKYRSEGATEE